jgi:CheY-like chemotaxis protein
MHTIVEAAIEAVRPSADNRGVQLICDLHDASEPILCDPSRMQQVVWNLLSNAIKFTPPGGQVRVTSEREDRFASVTVADTGVGITAEFLPHVFDRFRQQDPATTRKYGGLGLGLSIVRHLVELHGGTVMATSNGEGKGATFTVRVPVAPARGDQAGAVPLQGSLSDAGELPVLTGVRVLVVDNEADARALVATVLERCGAHVTTVSSAPEAIRRISEERPDVLVSDIAMPGQDGYDLIRELRRLERIGPPIPAAALTAFATATDRARALLAGYQAHLPKPVEPSELAAVVAALAGRTAVRS